VKDKIQIFSKGKIKGYESSHLEPWQGKNKRRLNEHGEVVEENENEEEFYISL